MDAVNVIVELGWPAMRWLFATNRPYIAIDGTVHRRTWGPNELALSPGPHVIEAWWATMLSSKTNPASLTLEVAPGEIYRLRYRPSWLRFNPGSLRIVEGPLPKARLVPP